jgi:hypothetical protein
MIISLLKRRVASDASVARLGQLAMFTTAGLVPVLVFRKFAALELTEVQLLLGVLATISVALLCTLLGMVTGLRARIA